MNLPEKFADRMRWMLGADYDAFLAAYDRPNTPALRLNPKKCPDGTLKDARLSSCLGESVVWATDGYYYHPEDDVRPGKHPYHEAGAYYIQEASAMIPASLCPPIEGDKVLDLCAAPGGKTTQLAAALGDGGLLVSNEIHPQRAAILSQNVERMGIRNAVVTCHAPHELAVYFPSFFDKIVVDAPCSGEGMFRKELQALDMWSTENVTLCAQRQKEILESAARMLAPDGYLTYSTCTFAPEENEGVILSFLLSHPEFEVVSTRNTAVLECLDRGVLDRGVPEWVSAPDEYADQLRLTVRLFPHHADGEGHYAALLHKSATASAGNDGARAKREKEKKKPRDAARGKDRSMTPDAAYSAYCSFSESIGAPCLEGVPCMYGDQLYLVPRQMPEQRDGLRTLRHGLHLGSIVSGGRFEPAHALSVALNVNGVRNVFTVDTEGARAYLHGDVLPCNDEKGWYVVSLDKMALGWGKASGSMMKNHYPKGLRKNF